MSTDAGAGTGAPNVSRPLYGTLAVAQRLLRSLRGDRRTLALVLVVPAFLVFLFGEVFEGPAATRVAPPLFAVVVFMLTYMLTAIGFLRERSSGTLERVLVTPVSRTGLVTGYVLGFGVLAAAQSLVLFAAGVAVLDLTFERGALLFVGVMLLGALVALGLGILLSLFAETEFQALQFVPVVITPQVVLGGTFAPVETLPQYLELAARAMPLTYLLDAMAYVVLDEGTAGEFRVALAVLGGFVVLSVAVATAVVRRAR